MNMNYNWDKLNKKTYNNRVGKYKYQTKFNFIVMNGKNNFLKIFDIAGGSGRFAIPLCKYSKNITVIDINKTAIQILNERNSVINTISDDFENAIIEDTFSLIICIEALDYFSDWNGFIKKTYDLLDSVHPAT